jgi:hypothetical protein
MAIEQILSLLKAEHDRLSRAINALEGSAKRVGRAPRQLTSPKSDEAAPPAPAKKRKGRTAAQRKAQAERMKAYWAKRKKAREK